MENDAAFQYNADWKAIMIDSLSPECRSRVMAQIRSKNTMPELAVRSLVFGMGYRYRIHDKELPGKPDLAFRGRRKVIFVNGCFWHGHGCKYSRVPKSRVRYWSQKISGNKERDRRNIEALRRLGWTVMVVWTCELKDLAALRERTISFLTPAH